MSTTAHTLGEVQGRDEPDRIFQRQIFSNPEICSSCFRQLKTDYIRTAWGSTGTDVEPKAQRAKSIRIWTTEPGEIGPEGPCVGSEQVEITTQAKYPVRTVCEDCGSISGRADDDPLSRREALRRAETLADRLHELREPINPRVLKHCVGHLKSLEEFTSRDTEVFEAATTIAVRRGRKRL